MLITALLLALAVQPAETEPIIVVGNNWAPFISPMGEPFRSRAAGDDPLARWFGGADRNVDTNLSLVEMDADATRFFARLDVDGDRQILPEELVAYESQVAPEIQVNSRWRDPRGEGKSKRRGDRRSGYDPRGLQGAARYTLLNIPQPVAAADTDFDRAITIEEFQRAAAHRFQLLDKNNDHRLDLAELRAQLPPARKDHRPDKIDENYRDPRIGNSVPVKD